jgi:hypothetical protein
MGVVAADLDDDGWIDVFQTNDSAPNFLLRNLGDGRFATWPSMPRWLSTRRGAPPGRWRPTPRT